MNTHLRDENTDDTWSFSLFLIGVFLIQWKASYFKKILSIWKVSYLKSWLFCQWTVLQQSWVRQAPTPVPLLEGWSEAGPCGVRGWTKSWAMTQGSNGPLDRSGDGKKRGEQGQKPPLLGPPHSRAKLRDYRNSQFNPGLPGHYEDIYIMLGHMLLNVKWSHFELSNV